MWSQKTGGLSRQVLFKGLLNQMVFRMWSLKTGGLSRQWSLKTGSTVLAWDFRLQAMAKTGCAKF